MGDIKIWREEYEIISEMIATGAGAMDESLAPGVAFRPTEIRLHLNAAGGTSEDFEVTIDSDHGTAYDGLPLARDMETVKDLIQDWSDKKRVFNGDDSLVFTYPNSNGRTWGLEVKYQKLA